MPKLLQFTVCFTLAFNVNEVCPFYCVPRQHVIEFALKLIDYLER